MKLAIMQPYLFPYIGYWQLINTVDKFVVYDNIQFSKKGWFHRNNILLNNKKTMFTIPLKKDSDYLNVVERCISDDGVKQQKKIMSQIDNAYRKAPFFEDIIELLRSCFLNPEKNLFQYILFSIKEVLRVLEIDTEIIISSEININHDLKSEDKVLAICKELGSSEYINPIGGLKLYNSDTFMSKGIELLFLKSKLPEYKQFNDEFIPYLSIIDCLMFNSLADMKNDLLQFDIIKNGKISDV